MSNESDESNAIVPSDNMPVSDDYLVWEKLITWFFHHII